MLVPKCDDLGEGMAVAVHRQLGELSFFYHEPERDIVGEVLTFEGEPPAGEDLGIDFNDRAVRSFFPG